MFRLRALGGLSLESDSEVLPASAHQRRRLALLVLLARAGERGISRDRLLALLWPESASDSARHALDQLLYATRRDLGKLAVASEAGQLRLNPEVVCSDCGEFQRCLQREEWEAAVGLYQGPFLDGVHLGGSAELERWADTTRAELEAEFAGVLEALARQAEQRGDVQAAVQWWRKRAGAEPLSGRAATGLAQALVGAGDAAGALRYLRTYRALLREELGTEPAPELLVLAERLVREPERRAPGPSPSGGADEQPEPAPEPAPPVRAPGTPRRAARPGRRAVLGGVLALMVGLTGAIVFASANAPADRSAGKAPAPSAPAAGEGAKHAPDPAAHALYLRARIAWDRRSRDGLQQAVVLFRQATERDPLYAEAHAGLASAYVILGYLGYLPGDATFPKGRAAALQALALDPREGEAYAALGVALQWERRWAEAEQALLRAVTYAPRYATGHQWYALLLSILGRRGEALAHGKHAVELDPLSVQISNTYAILLVRAGQPDSALRVFERVVTNEPDTAWVRENPWVLANFAKVAAASGRAEEAVRLAERAAEAVPGHPRPLHDLALAHLAMGNAARARAAFAAADPAHPHYPVYRALLHAHLGDLDSAFAWLDRVEEWSPVMLLTLAGDPTRSALHRDPRFAALRRRVGLPPPR